MDTNFICPQCKGYLNVDDLLVLAAYNEKGDAGIILLHQELGNYSIKTNSDFDIETGKKYDFFCPVCKEKFASELHENLSKIQMLDKDGHSYDVLFSRIAGEKSTYKIIGEAVDVYGEHSSNYIDFINLSYNK